MGCKVYRFPANKRAKELDSIGQIDYVTSEADEALNACACDEGPDRIIEELFDTIQAAEGALRKFSEQRVRDGYYKVVAKCQDRGDYDIKDLVRSDWGLA